MKAAIILNGEALSRDVTEDFVVCADGGYSLFHERYPGKRVNALIGDLDSLKEIPKDVFVIKYPPEKNCTDGELALDYVLEKGYKEITFYAAGGGRNDHFLGNLALLSKAYEQGANTLIKENGYDILFAGTGHSTFPVRPGDTVSVIPYGGAVTVASSGGLAYPLNNLHITPSSTRGISNIAEKSAASLEIAKGRALVFHYFKDWRDFLI